jgi:hypothetical protein
MGSNYQGLWELNGEFMRGPDFDRTVQILKFIKRYSNSFSTSYFLNEVKTVSRFMTSDRFWNPISVLSDEIMSSTKYQLGKAEIESCLEDVGYIDYVNELRSK